MTQLLVSLDVPTAAEAVRTARTLADADCAARVGPRLLNRVGPGVIAGVRAFLPVMADARLNGSTAEVRAAAQSLVGHGASWVTVAGSLGTPGVVAAVEAASRRGANVYATTVPPEAPEDQGRGREVSRRARALADSGVAGVLGTIGDIGVVVQVASALGVVVLGAESPADVREASVRGATAVVVNDGIARSADPVRALRPHLLALGLD